MHGTSFNPGRRLRILVFRMGQIGDTVVALPALWALRDAFPDSERVLLTERHPGKEGYASPWSVLEGTGLLNEVMYFRHRSTLRSRFGLFREAVRTIWQIRRGKFDLLVYLAPLERTQAQQRRDLRLFRLAGIRRLIGAGENARPPALSATSSQGIHQADFLLARLAESGIAVPEPGNGKMDLGLGPAEEEVVNAWLARQPSDGGRRWIAVGPASKMPAKVWPAERYEGVVRKLIGQFGVWPVVFGGPADRELGRRLLDRWGEGYLAAGELGVRADAAALRRCALYLGNDTGTMHLAAAAGTRCVAVFSARDPVGLWYPYGAGHVVLRKAVPCEGCVKEVCIEQQMTCIMQINEDEVYRACAEMLGADRAHQGSSGAPTTIDETPGNARS